MLFKLLLLENIAGMLCGVWLFCDSMFLHSFPVYAQATRAVTGYITSRWAYPWVGMHDVSYAVFTMCVALVALQRKSLLASSSRTLPRDRQCDLLLVQSAVIVCVAIAESMLLSLVSRIVGTIVCTSASCACTVHAVSTTADRVWCQQAMLWSLFVVVLDITTSYMAMKALNLLTDVANATRFSLQSTAALAPSKSVGKVALYKRRLILSWMGLNFCPIVAAVIYLLTNFVPSLEVPQIRVGILSSYVASDALLVLAWKPSAYRWGGRSCAVSGA